MGLASGRVAQCRPEVARVNDASTHAAQDEADGRAGARGELKACLFLTVVMAPVIAGLTIAGYGFLVWFYQMMIAGPPTH
jgi:periplasmic nitrate reductase NapE